MVQEVAQDLALARIKLARQVERDIHFSVHTLTVLPLAPAAVAVVAIQAERQADFMAGAAAVHTPQVVPVGLANRGSLFSPTLYQATEAETFS